LYAKKTLKIVAILLEGNWWLNNERGMEPNISSSYFSPIAIEGQIVLVLLSK